MTYQELQDKIKEITRLVDDRYRVAMNNYQDYCYECRINNKVLVKAAPQRSEFVRNAQISVDRLRKEFAMQTSPADIGDIIESEKREVGRNGHVKETRYLMRVERIEVSSFGKPVLAFYGTYLTQNLEPRMQQIQRPILQPDITMVVKSATNR